MMSQYPVAHSIFYSISTVYVLHSNGSFFACALSVFYAFFIVSGFYVPVTNTNKLSKKKKIENKFLIFSACKKCMYLIRD